MITGMAKMKNNRENRLCRSVFNKWLLISRQTAPVRRMIHATVEKINSHRQKQMLIATFNALKSVTIGLQSRRQANKERKQLIEDIRSELSMKLKRAGEIGVVPEEDVVKYFYRRILANFLEKKRFLQKKTIFIMLVKLVRQAKNNEMLAKRHWLLKRTGVCLYSLLCCRSSLVFHPFRC
jgi:hypothetical protein